MTTTTLGPMFALLALHVLAAATAPAVAGRIGKRVLLVVGIAPAAMFVWALSQSAAVLDGEVLTESIAWAPGLGFDLSLRLDAFALLMVLIVSGIGAAVFVYSFAYFGERLDIGRLSGLLVGFAGAMLGLVLADNVIALFLFWELTSITSYLLIGLDDRSATARAAAQRALLTTAAAGLALLAGLVLVAQQAGTWSISGILADPPTGTITAVALVLILIGAFAKSAQVPFQYWLPGAMAAPTPVSAYLHSATMVKAGIVVIARFAPGFADVGVWRPLVVVVGLSTMVIGGWQALRQDDLKLLLAHGTVSQLGLMVVLFGLGYPAATAAGTVLLLAHALFKATLFMVVGIVDHQAHTRDLRRLDRLYGPLRATFLVASIGAASMAGLPPLLGFIAKESAYEALAHDATAELGSGGWLVLGVVVAGSMLTFAYSARLIWGGFGVKRDEDLADDLDRRDPQTVRPAHRAFLAPAAVLAALTVVAGIAPGLVDPLVSGASTALDGDVPVAPLALWHGVNLALVLSGVTIAVGVLLFLARRPIDRFQQRIRLLPSGARAFDVGLARTLQLADTVTGRVQSGSLPIYLAVILSTVLIVPGAMLVAGIEAPGELVVFDRPMQLVVGALMIVATIGAVLTVHRLAAVLCVGAVGYGVAVLFVIQGAPDLALTQLLIENLVLVLFVLVLRHLPLRFEGAHTAIPWVPRLALSLAVGVFLAVFAIAAFSSRPDIDPVSVEMAQRSVPDGGGRNIVNVILVDFRAFDTMGEIVVLTVTALGVMGLVRAARRSREREHDDPELEVSHAHIDRYRRSSILESAVNTLFRTVLLFSIVLLLVGHDEPGGGFIAGLVAGGAFMLVFLAGGAPRLRRIPFLGPEALLGIGVAVAATAGTIGWYAGGEFLDALTASIDLGILGSIKLSTVLLFDFGVYLVVIGLVLALLESLGPEEQVEPT
jgi:multicomponent Na+:H+ antiporter subunit A